MPSRVIADQRVSPHQPFHRKLQAAQLVLSIRVRSGDIEKYLRRKILKRPVQMLFQDRQVIVVTYSVRQIHVHRGNGFRVRIIVLLVQRKRVHRSVPAENLGRAIPLVYVRIDHERILEICRPYLGKVVGEYSDWNPLFDRERLFPEDLDKGDPWQFKNFRVV